MYYSQAKQDFFGSSPNIFVGRYGYPDIRVGFLSVEDKSNEYDNPTLWASQDYDVGKVVDLSNKLGGPEMVIYNGIRPSLVSLVSKRLRKKLDGPRSTKIYEAWAGQLFIDVLKLRAVLREDTFRNKNAHLGWY